MTENQIDSEQICLKKDQRENLKIKYKNQRLQEAKEIYKCECGKVYLSFPALYLHVKNKHKLKLTTKINDKICKIEQIQDKTHITYFLKYQSQFLSPIENSSRDRQNKNFFRFEGMRTSQMENDQFHDHSMRNNFYNNYFHANIYQRSLSYGSEEIKLEIIIRRFIGENQFNHNFQTQWAREILTLFVEYIQKVCTFSKQFDELKVSNGSGFVQQIPLFMNEFVSFYLPSVFRVDTNIYPIRKSPTQIIKIFCDWLYNRKYTNLKIYLSK